jgi:hypothetical protein
LSRACYQQDQGKQIELIFLVQLTLNKRMRHAIRHRKEYQRRNTNSQVTVPFVESILANQVASRNAAYETIPG